jgi:hypothetical protein
MKRIFLLTAATHLAILVISVAVPTLVYKKWRKSIALSGVISFVLYVLFMYLYFQVRGLFGIAHHPFFREAHEVGWLATIVATVVCCKILHRARTARS